MLRHYLIWSWRGLLADPLTTLLNLLALSLGLVSFALAAATALFLKSNDATLPNAERIYAVSEQILNADGTSLFPRLPMTSAPVTGYMAADFPEFEAVTMLLGGDFQQAVVRGRNQQLAPMFFDENFARLFKLPLRHGDPEKAFSQPRAVILTAEAAEKLFGDSDPVGQSLRLGKLDVTITGVLDPLTPPSTFRSTPGNHIDMLASPDLRHLLAPPQPEPDAWDNYAGFTMVLLPPGQSVAGMRAKLADFGTRHVQRLQRQYKFDLIPLTDLRQELLNSFLGTDKTGLSIPPLLVMLGGLVLLMASLNYTNLATAKAIGRLPESGMKKMLGAERGELLAQYMVESLTLTLLAMILVLGVLTAVAGPFKQVVGADLTRLLFHRPAFWLELAGAVTAATFAGGLYPAWLLSGPKAMAAALGGKIREARSTFSAGLVGIQFLTAGVLMIMVAIILQQNRTMSLIAHSLGDSELLAIDTVLDGQDIGPRDVRNALHDCRGVIGVAGSSALPWSTGPGMRRYFKDAKLTDAAKPGTDFEVTEEYFSVMGSHLLAGREFSADRGGDLKPDADVPETAYNIVIDRDFAQSFGWTPDQAVGQTIWHHTLTGGSAPVQIIGVIETQPQLMLSLGATGAVYTLMPSHAVLPLVRLAAGSGPETLAEIDRALNRLSPQIDWHRHFSDELFKDASEILTIVIAALGGLALFAVVISLLGLTGMAVHITNSRTEEIGIRKILGADQWTILRLLAWDLTKPVLIASLAAWPIGFAAGKVYLSLFVAHVALGPWPFLASLATTLTVAWIAVGWRIARASAKSPAEILRYE